LTDVYNTFALRTHIGPKKLSNQPLLALYCYSHSNIETNGLYYSHGGLETYGAIRLESQFTTTMAISLTSYIKLLSLTLTIGL